MTVKSNFVSIILARGNSKAIKLKNLYKVNDKPLIYWTLQNSLNSKKIHSTWVSSDNKKILDYSSKIGANIIKRPKNFARDNSSSESAWKHAIEYIEKKGIRFNNVVCLQTTSPIRKKNDIDNAINIFIKNGHDSLFSGHLINPFFTYNKLNGKLNPNFEKRITRQNFEDTFNENGSFYIFKKKGFLKHKKRTFGKIGVYKMSKLHSFEIDDYSDIKIINSLKKYF
tara:strand:+ start:567 stop:1244 length:678 start_codon:yes stop_codon:yes gene_type:complete